jgi:hypothetical protein
MALSLAGQIDESESVIVAAVLSGSEDRLDGFPLTRPQHPSKRTQCCTAAYLRLWAITGLTHRSKKALLSDPLVGTVTAGSVAASCCILGLAAEVLEALHYEPRSGESASAM